MRNEDNLSDAISEDLSSDKSRSYAYKDDLSTTPEVQGVHWWHILFKYVLYLFCCIIVGCIKYFFELIMEQPLRMVCWDFITLNIIHIVYFLAETSGYFVSIYTLFSWVLVLIIWLLLVFKLIQ